MGGTGGTPAGHRRDTGGTPSTREGHGRDTSERPAGHPASGRTPKRDRPDVSSDWPDTGSRGGRV